jgi:hypothetical protein
MILNFYKTIDQSLDMVALNISLSRDEHDKNSDKSLQSLAVSIDFTWAATSNVGNSRCSS